MTSSRSPAPSSRLQTRSSSQQGLLRASTTPQRHQLRGWQAERQVSRQQQQLRSRLSAVAQGLLGCQCKQCLRFAGVVLSRGELCRASMAGGTAHLGAELRWLGSSWTSLRYGGTSLGTDACRLQMIGLLLSS